jgi:aspartyl-tRNA(Asn)/glutamyl-tRNA(Gln) amidotransferase subunit A
MPELRTVVGIRDAIARGEQSAAAACAAALRAIAETNPALGAFITVAGEQAVARAEAIDSSDGTGALRGVPLALKDNICTLGVETTAGSRMLRGYVPPRNATIVDRLEAAGAIILGKTNCDEFAMGSSTENSAFGPARNPWDLARTPGGSSGGSAVAVAAGLVPAALGSDTGGSVRQPAAFCGLVGLKPTYGRVSRYGLIAFASSLDQIGPLTHTIRDAALLLSVIAGPDRADATAADMPVPDFEAGLDDAITGVRVGVPRELLGDGLDPEVRDAYLTALARLESLGAVLEDVRLPHAGHAIPVYYLVATAEASSNLARYDGVRYGYRSPEARTLLEMYTRTRDEGFGPEVKRRIMLGTYVLSAGYYDAYYLKAQQVRTLIRRDYEEAFARVDAVAMPTTPTPPFLLGEKVADPLQMYLADVFTVSANLSGLPSVSVPCGFTTGRLPIGLQLTGRAFDEATMLRVAHAYEQANAWWHAEPTPRGSEKLETRN